MRKDCPRLKVEFPSDVGTGNPNVDNVKATYLSHPESHPSDLAMILLHGFTMRRDYFLQIGELIRESGVSCFLMDLPYHGERGINGDGYVASELSSKQIKMALEQSYSDIEKSVGLLKNWGHKEVGIGGYSLGGILTLGAMGRDKRLRKGIAVCAGGNLADLIFNSPIVEHLAEGLRKEGVDQKKLAEILAELEPCNFARNIDPEGLLMVNCKSDELVPPKNTEEFISCMRGEPMIDWQEGGHGSPNLTNNVLGYLTKLGFK